MSNLTLIIPAKNEKESLPKVLDEIKKINLNCKIKVCLSSDDLETINSIKTCDFLKVIGMLSMAFDKQPSCANSNLNQQ